MGCCGRANARAKAAHVRACQLQATLAEARRERAEAQRCLSKERSRMTQQQGQNRVQQEQFRQALRRAEQQAEQAEARQHTLQREHAKQMTEQGARLRAIHAQSMRMWKADPAKDKKIAELQKEIDGIKDKDYTEVSDMAWRNFLKKAEGLDFVEKQPAAALAVVGRRGAGKSSFCNALAGRKVASVGVVDTTTQIWKVSDEPYQLWDVPGETDMRSIANLQSIMQMKTMHVLVIMYSEGQVPTKLASLAYALKVPLLVVRNKCDNDFTEKSAKEANMSVEDHVKMCFDNEKAVLLDHLQQNSTVVDFPLMYIVCDPNGEVPPGVSQMPEVREELDRILTAARTAPPQGTDAKRKQSSERDISHLHAKRPRVS